MSVCSQCLCNVCENKGCPYPCKNAFSCVFPVTKCDAHTGKITVYLRLDDRDFHGECDCGLCNANGISYGVSIRDLKADPEDNVLIRIYGPAEETALVNAETYSKKQGWHIAEFNEELSDKGENNGY